MKLYAVLILATFFAKNAEAKTESKDAQDGFHKTAAELAKLIHLVSGYVGTETELDTDETDETEETEETEEKRVDASDLQPFDLDYFIVRSNQPHSQQNYYKQNLNENSEERPNHRIKKIGKRLKPKGWIKKIKPHMNKLWRKIRKNKLNRPRSAKRPQTGHHEQDDQDKRSRFHFLRNQGEREAYKKIRRPAKPAKYNHHREENSDSGSNSEERTEDNQRRNAIFRLDTDSIEDDTPKTKDKSSKTKYNRKSVEDFKERNFDISKESFENIRHDVDVFVDDVNRKKGREEDGLKQDNAWDVITKKYEWNDQHSNEDYKSAKKLKKTKYNDDFNKKTTKNYDDWDKKITKYEDWPKDNWNSVEKKQKKKNKNWDSFEIKPHKESNVKTKSNKGDSYEKLKKKENKKNDWENITVFKIIAPKTTKKWKLESIEEGNKVYSPKKQFYSRVKKSRDGFDSSNFFGRTPIPYVGRQGIYVDNDN